MVTGGHGKCLPLFCVFFGGVRLRSKVLRLEARCGIRVLVVVVNFWWWWFCEDRVVVSGRWLAFIILDMCDNDIDVHLTGNVDG